MRSVSVREMRTALPRLERLLEEEGEIVITRNGKPVASNKRVDVVLRPRE